MSKQDQSMKMQQICVLKVNIQCRCDGCKKKIKKLLHKIDGVYNAQINAEQGKVIVTGNVDPAKLIKKLEKSGKHAELWGAPKGSNGFQNLPNSQFKNMQQFDHGKGGRSGDDKISQKGSKGGQQGQQLMQQYKGSNKDVKMPHKDQKSVKFDLQDDYVDASDDDFDNEFDDEFDDEFDYEDDDEEEEAGYGHGQGQGHHLPNKMMPPMMNNKMVPPMMNNDRGPQGHHGMINGRMFNFQKTDGDGGGNGMKGGGDFEIPVGIKGKGGSNNGNKEKKGGGGGCGSGSGGGGGKNAHNKGENQKQDGKDKSKSGSKSGFGAFWSFGRKSKNGREETTGKSTKSDRSAAYNNIKGVKKGGSAKLEGQVQDFGSKRYDSNKTKQGYHDIDFNGGGIGGVAKTGPVGHMHPMANYGGMVNFPAMQGHPALNGGAYQATGNPYNQHQQQQLQQQQYMAMMMNQQRQSGNDMFQPMMYARPQPAFNYMPPPPMPSHPMAGPYTDVFSDENTDSCSIM